MGGDCTNLLRFMFSPQTTRRYTSKDGRLPHHLSWWIKMETAFSVLETPLSYHSQGAVSVNPFFPSWHITMHFTWLTLNVWRLYCPSYRQRFWVMRYMRKTQPQLLNVPSLIGRPFLARLCVCEWVRTPAFSSFLFHLSNIFLSIPLLSSLLFSLSFPSLLPLPFLRCPHLLHYRQLTSHCPIIVWRVEAKEHFFLVQNVQHLSS